MIEQQIDMRPRRDRGQAFQEFVRGKDQVAGAVMPRMPEGADDAAVGQSREPLLRQRWAQQVAAESFEAHPVVGSGGGEESLEVLADDLVEDGLLGVARGVAEGRDGGATGGTDTAPGRCGHDRRSWQSHSTAASLRVDSSVVRALPREVSHQSCSYGSSRDRRPDHPSDGAVLAP